MARGAGVQPPAGGAIGGTEDRDWQRLDKWLWCARVATARSDCARLVADGAVRINRQPTDKPHYRLRPGDVLTLARRRGPAPEARGLYEDLGGGAA